MTTKIEWVQGDDGARGDSWNPLAGCSMISPGCTHCYAMKDAHRLAGNPNPKIAAKYQGTTRLGAKGPVWTGKVNLVPEELEKPLKRKKPTTYFVNSMSDLFHAAVPDEFIDRVFATMALAHWHTFQVLTKRADRMAAYCSEGGLMDRIYEASRHAGATISGMVGLSGRLYGPQQATQLPNVWLGVSVEDQARADERIPHLLKVPAAVRFLSVEPLLGSVDLTAIGHGDQRGLDALTGEFRYYREDDGEPCSDWGAAIDWVIGGFESGPGARPGHPDWARSLRDQCVKAVVPFFWKQWGEWVPDGQALPYLLDVVGGRGAHEARALFPDGRHCPDLTGRGTNGDGAVIVRRVGKRAAGRLLDGRTWDEMPAATADVRRAARGEG